MKVIILVGALLAGNFASADIVKMKRYLPNGTWVGKTDYNSLCKIEVNWISESVLKVKSYEKYKDNSVPLKLDILFSNVHKVKLNETSIEFSLSQLTTLLQNDDYQLDQYEKLSLELIDKTKLKSITLFTAKIDYQNDPHENNIICRKLNKIK